MSFDAEFNPRWEKVIKPAINRLKLKDGNFLEAHRVDIRKISDSILTEILGEISNSLLVLADISTL